MVPKWVQKANMLQPTLPVKEVNDVKTMASRPGIYSQYMALSHLDDLYHR